MQYLTLLLSTTLTLFTAHTVADAPAEFSVPIDITKDILVNWDGNTRTQGFDAANCYGNWDDAKRCRKVTDGTFVPKTFVVGDRTVWQCCFDGGKVPYFSDAGEKSEDVLKAWREGAWDV